MTKARGGDPMHAGLLGLLAAASVVAYAWYYSIDVLRVLS